MLLTRAVGQPLERPGAHPEGGQSSLQRRFRSELCLLAGCALLALAATGPPDPLWISGMYDGGDSDELVALSSDGSLPDAPPALVQARAEPGQILLPVEPEEAPALAGRPLRPRAPPVA